MRIRARLVALVLLGELLLIAALIVGTGRDQDFSRAPNRRLAKAVRLNDVVLTAEPSYCRHLTQADRFAPFADFPAAPEHYPAGSIVFSGSFSGASEARRP